MSFTISSTYRRYKKETEIVRTWLETTAKARGYKKHQEQRATSTHTCPRPQDQASEENEQSDKGTSSAPVVSQEAQILILSTYVPMAEFVVALTAPIVKIPLHITQALDQAIRLRKQHSVWKQQDDSPTGRSTRGHIHCINVLKSVRDIFMQHSVREPSVSKSASKQHKDSNKQQSSVLNRYAVLPMDEVSTAPDVDDSTVRKPLRSNEDSRKQNLREEDVDYFVYEEFQFAIFCLLCDLDELRQYLRTVWTIYRSDTQQLQLASIITNTAVEFVKTFEHELIEMLPGLTNLTEIMDEIYGRRGSDGMLDPVFNQTYIGLSRLSEALPDDGTPLSKVKRFSKDNSLATSSNPDAKIPNMDGYTHMKVFIEVLPSLCALGSLPYPKDELTRSIYHLVDTNSVSLWAAFATQIFLDIHQVMQSDIAQGYREYTDILESMARTCRETIELHQTTSSTVLSKCDDMLLAPHLATLKDVMSNKKLAGLLSEAWSTPVSRVDSFSLHKQHPWFCGMQSFFWQALTQHFSMCAMNTWQDVSSCAHLYNAALQQNLLSTRWPDMDLVLAAIDTKWSYLSTLPKTSQQFYTRYAMNSGISVASLVPNARPARPIRRYRPPREVRFHFGAWEMFRKRWLTDGNHMYLRPNSVNEFLAAHTKDDPQPQNTRKPNVLEQGKASNVECLQKLFEALSADAWKQKLDICQLHRCIFDLFGRIKSVSGTDLEGYFGKELLAHDAALVHALVLPIFFFMKSSNPDSASLGMKLLRDAAKEIEKFAVSEEGSKVSKSCKR